MKIIDIKTFVVDCYRTNWVFVKVYTDEGIAGVGEGTLEYKEKALTGAVGHIRSALLGKDPRQIEKHWHDLYRDAYWRRALCLRWKWRCGIFWEKASAFRSGSCWAAKCMKTAAFTPTVGFQAQKNPPNLPRKPNLQCAAASPR